MRGTRAVTPRPRRAPATHGQQAAEPGPAVDVRWLRPATAAPRTVDPLAVARQLDGLGPLVAGEWRAAQLVAFLVSVDLDAGPGGPAARWDVGTVARIADLASRTGLDGSEVERALVRLGEAGVFVRGGDHGPFDGIDVRSDDVLLTVSPACVTEGPIASVAWGPVADALTGSPAALLVARALAGCTDRLERPAVVPHATLVRATRYSEGMVKRGVAAVRRAGVVSHHPSAGRAPAYTFSNWALGRAAARDVALPPPSAKSRPSSNVASADDSRGASRVGPSAVDVSAVLRASLAGVHVEVPAVTGGELVVETVIDGRPVTARLTIPRVSQ